MLIFPGSWSVETDVRQMIIVIMMTCKFYWSSISSKKVDIVKKLIVIDRICGELQSFVSQFNHFIGDWIGVTLYIAGLKKTRSMPSKHRDPHRNGVHRETNGCISLKIFKSHRSMDHRDNEISSRLQSFQLRTFTMTVSVFVSTATNFSVASSESSTFNITKSASSERV